MYQFTRIFTGVSLGLLVALRVMILIRNIREEYGHPNAIFRKIRR